MDINERVIRVPFAGMLLAALGVAALGFLGGLAGVWWFSPNPLPLPTAGDQLVTTIEEVTISPSLASAENVARHGRSVVLLSPVGHPEQVLGTGFVVTSDGLIATTAAVPGEAVAALDENGRAAELTLVGSDSVFGITYLRAGGGVFVPFDVRDSDVGEGSMLVALSRNPETLATRAQPFFVEEYRLPEISEPAGWQRVLGGSELTEAAVVGSPLLDDEGRVAGMVLPGRNGRVLSGTLLRLSLDRVAAGQLERNPYENVGLDLGYRFISDADGVRKFTAIVEAVRPGSAAAGQGVRPGDTIITLQGQVPVWDVSLYPLFQKPEPLAAQLQRGETILTVAFSTSAAASPSP